HALVHNRNPELRRALRRRGRVSRRQHPDFQTRALRPDEPRAVLDVELLALRAVGMEQDLAVGQDAVDVEQYQFDVLRLRLNGHVSDLRGAGMPGTHLVPRTLARGTWHHGTS